MQEQDEGGGERPGDGVHHDVGDHVDGGDKEGQVDGCAAHQGHLDDIIKWSVSITRARS